MYRVVLDTSVPDQVDALPDEAVRALADVFTVLEQAPETGRPYNDDNPGGPMRQIVFGADGRGSVTYLVLGREREVHVLVVQWVG